MTHLRRVLAVMLFAGVSPWASAQQAIINMEQPGERDFVLDKADLIDPADEEQIREIADRLLTVKVTPIIVVTIKSMAAHGAAGMRIETFANLLFDQWQIGYEKLNNQTWNTGILLLVSEQDRKARIELGAGWGQTKNAQAQQIMDEQIIPRFKEGRFSAGILAGVEGLDAMARDLELPAAHRPWWHWALVAGFIGLAIFTVVSLIRRGSSGWAWLMWAAIFSVIGYLLYQGLQNSSSGGGFSGGSFGGGFSGGGGATGSW